MGRRSTGSNHRLREETMKTWRKPKVRELSVGTEINAYACAHL
ncbi:pyrroloquinoline quinone precursor peptide PqqA [Azospirillum oleiclasticum]|nr:pyrroloquinoline quinone precursor peptide PqqA [Azospirillum oleiclasticum]